MQVVFGGLSVTIAIVALVIGYFAWVQPHSPDDNTGDDNAGRAESTPTTPSAAGVSTTGTLPTAQPTADGRRVPLAGLIPSVGGGNMHRTGSDLTMPCASGEATDRQRTVEYDLAGNWVAMTAKLTVSKAPDPDTKLQMKIFTDDRQAADVVLAKGKSAAVEVPLDGKQSLQIQLTCQSRDSEMTIGAPTLTHVQQR